MVASGVYPKSRLDALTDGIYAVAMTLLVLDIRLPEGTRALSDRDLVAALFHLWPKLLPYVISFFALAFHWMSIVKTRTRADQVNSHHAIWTLFDLLLVTFLPFSATVLGRYPENATAVCLYSANIGLMAAVGLWIMNVDPDVQHDWRTRERMVAAATLLTSALLAAGVSFFEARYATLTYMLNVLPPLLRRRREASAS